MYNISEIEHNELLTKRKRISIFFPNDVFVEKSIQRGKNFE